MRGSTSVFGDRLESWWSWRSEAYDPLEDYLEEIIRKPSSELQEWKSEVYDRGANYSHFEEIFRQEWMSVEDVLRSEERVEVKHCPDVLNQLEEHIARKRRQVVEMEMEKRGLPAEIIGDEISLSDMKVKLAFTRVKRVLKCINPCLLNDQVANELRKHESSQFQVRWLDYRREIQTAAKFLECIFKEIDGKPTFAESVEFEKLRVFNERLMKFVGKWNSSVMENGAESSGERRKPQSKGVVFKRNALRRQHNSQRDDPEELFPDLVELETILEDCVLDQPQLLAFGGDLIHDVQMPAIQLSNQGCGEVNQLSMAGISAVGNKLVFVV